MTATDIAESSRIASADAETRRVINSYYLAMLAPCAVDIGISGIYCLVHRLGSLFLTNTLIALLLLGVGGHIVARILLRPVSTYLRDGGNFNSIERRLTQLPLLSARAMLLIYTPIMLLRLLPSKFGILMDPGIPIATWADVIVTLVIELIFLFVFTYFLISGYLEQLCRFLFERRGVNLNLFFGRFQTKLAVALVFIGVGPTLMIGAEIFSYAGDRLVDEVTVDLLATAFCLGITLYWVSRTLARPLARLDEGMRRVADGDLSVRLPVTSNEEVGQATAQFNRMAEGLRERDFLRETFGKYVSESVAAAILAEEERDGRLLGQTRTATLLFTDIDGFTGISETTSPARLIAVLNEYLALVLEPIQRHGGVVSSFIGDGLFASFNLPASHQNHAAAALAAAIEIQERLHDHDFGDGIRLRTRIGINTGPVIGGTIGHGDRLSYTLLGDAVNTAARLQEMNKIHSSRILVSGETLQLAGNGFSALHVGDVEIRGRVERIPAYAITGRL